MAKQNPKSSIDNHIIEADGQPLDLHNRYLAVFLAWIIPGAGHFYQRRYTKSAIFFLCIISSFVLGMFVGGGRCVYASWNGVERRWQFVLQAGVGLPAMPAVYQAWRAPSLAPKDRGGFMAPPHSTRDLSDWNAETASGMDMGTLYTMIAGLLNMLVMFDAFAGPLPPPVPKSRGDKQREDENAGASNAKSASSEASASAAGTG